MTLEGKITQEIYDFDKGIYLEVEGDNGQPVSDLDIPPLPNGANLSADIEKDACPWLDDYIAFSRKWSPRAFDGFHTACGLWLLSTLAARRVCTHLGGVRFTNLYFALTARTSLYAKSTTAGIAIQVLRQLGADYLLAPDSSTPQKFIADGSTTLIEDYEDLDDKRQERARKQVGMAGQRGWFYDEFGMHVSAMLRQGGFMADFRGLLRRFDDTPEDYSYASIGRGNDTIEHPYLALLASMTPDDLRPFVKMGSTLWGDGFLARFALIAPIEGERKTERFPEGERIIPNDLLMPLNKWHGSLGIPKVDVIDIVDNDGKNTGKKRVEVLNPITTTLGFGEGVFDAFYSYHDGLLDIVEANDNHDLDGNYVRFSEKALRVALLFASLGGHKQIEMNHWARAQSITEDWRASLHRLYETLNEPGPSEEKQKEERLLKAIQKHGALTAAQAARYVRGMSSKEAAYLLDGLEYAGELQTEKTRAGTKRYDFSIEQ